MRTLLEKYRSILGGFVHPPVLCCSLTQSSGVNREADSAMTASEVRPLAAINLYSFFSGRWLQEQQIISSFKALH